MATQENEEVQAEELQVVQAEDSAAEDAGFNEAFGVAPVDETAADQAAEDQEDGAEEVQGEEQQADPTDEVPADDADAEEETPEQQAEADHKHLKGLLDSLPDITKKAEMTEGQIRQLNGKIGEINRLVQNLMANKDAAPASVKLTKDTFKRLSTDFPEIAEMLADDLSSISLPSARAEGQNPIDVQALIDAEVSKVRKEVESSTDAKLEARLLGMQHKDWHTVVNSQDFRTWMTTLSASEQEELNNSWNADFIAEKITAFKATKQKVDEKREQRNDRMSRALLPKTTTKVIDKGLRTEEEGFNAAF